MMCSGKFINCEGYISSQADHICRKFVFNFQEEVSDFLCMDSFYLHTGNIFSQLRYPHNLAGNFVVDLPRTIYFNGNWEVGISDISLERIFPESVLGEHYICSDIVETSIVGIYNLPFLRSFMLVDEERQHFCFDSLHYFKINTNFIQNLHFYFLDSKNKKEILNRDDKIFLTLHFRRQ